MKERIGKIFNRVFLALGVASLAIAITKVVGLCMLDSFHFSKYLIFEGFSILGYLAISGIAAFNFIKLNSGHLNRYKIYLSLLIILLCSTIMHNLIALIILLLGVGGLAAFIILSKKGKNLIAEIILTVVLFVHGLLSVLIFAGELREFAHEDLQQFIVIFQIVVAACMMISAVAPLLLRKLFPTDEELAEVYGSDEKHEKQDKAEDDIVSDNKEIIYKNVVRKADIYKRMYNVGFITFEEYANALMSLEKENNTF